MKWKLNSLNNSSNLICDQKSNVMILEYGIKIFGDVSMNILIATNNCFEEKLLSMEIKFLEQFK